MNAERDGVAGGEMKVRRGEGLFVKSVAGLVHHAEEGRSEVVLFVAGSETDIGGPEGGAKGMGGGIDTAVGKVEAKGFCDFAVKSLLGLDGSGTVEEVGGDGRGFFDCSGGNLGEFGINGVEESGHFAGLGAAFVFGEKSVVGFVFVAPVIGFLTGDFEKLGEVWGEGLELVFLASFEPGRFGEGGGFGIALDEFLRDFGRALVAVGEFALVGAIERSESVAEGIGCLQLVNSTVKVGKLLGSMGHGFCGSVGFLIPAQDGGG